MAIIKSNNSKATIKEILKYISNPDKTTEHLTTGINCSSDINMAEQQMMATKQIYNKIGGRQYKHFSQSFHPDDKITPEQAHQLGLEWIKHNKFDGFEVVMTTHTDKKHLHNHFVVNSVNFDNGYKYNHSKFELELLKDFSYDICRDNNLKAPQVVNNIERTKKIITKNNNKYMAIKNGNSFISYVKDAVDKALPDAIDKKSFIKAIEKQKINVRWIDKNKKVTFIIPEWTNKKGKVIEKHVRLSNLLKTFDDDKYTKDGLTKIFNHNYSNLKMSEKYTTRSQMDLYPATRKINHALHDKDLKIFRTIFDKLENENKVIDDKSITAEVLKRPYLQKVLKSRIRKYTEIRINEKDKIEEMEHYEYQTKSKQEIIRDLMLGKALSSDELINDLMVDEISNENNQSESLEELVKSDNEIDNDNEKIINTQHQDYDYGDDYDFDM